MNNRLFYSVLIILFFISCKKDSTVDNSNNNNNNNNSTTAPVFTSLISIDTTLAAPNDTISKLTIRYDAQGRVNLVIDWRHFSNGNTVNDSMRYYYNGNDTMVSRTIEQHHYTFSSGTPDNSIDTVDYVHSGNKIIYDSSYTYLHGHLRRYSARHITYSPGYTYVSSSDLDVSNTPYTVYGNYHTTSVNDCITYQLDTIEFIAPVQHFFSKDSAIRIYQDNPDPMYVLAKTTGSPFLYGGFTHYNFDGTYNDQKRLLVQEDYYGGLWGSVQTSNTTWQRTRTYTLRSDGYPAEAREVIDYSTATSIRTKFVYMYQ